MEVILLDKIAKLGGLGDKVTVKSGYARNFLLPKGKAVFASKANVEHFEARRAELEKKLADNLTAAEARAAKLTELLKLLSLLKLVTKVNYSVLLVLVILLMQLLKLVLKLLKLKYVYH